MRRSATLAENLLWQTPWWSLAANYRLIFMEKNEQAEQDLTQNATDQILEETQPTEENVTENEKEPTSDSQENKLETEVAELKEKYLRLYSDFENFRKRTAK